MDGQTDSPLSLHSFSSEKPNFRPSPRLSRRICHELSRLSQLAGPLYVQNVFAYSTTVVAVGFVGHLGQPVLLSSAVLANSLYNVTGSSIISGLSAGMETLCGQAYGAGSFKALGLVLQRALLILSLVCIPISLLWMYAEPLLLALGQEPAVAQGAALYLGTIIPTLFSGVVMECLRRYLLAQRVVLPGMVTTVLACCMCPVYNYLLVYKSSRGHLAQARPLYVLRLGRYLAYGLPAAAMICMEWWAYEIVIFMSGTIPNAELAVGVMGLLFQISAMAYMAPMAFGSSVNIRVSNKLGSGDARAAQVSCYTAVGVVALVSGVLAVTCWLFARQVAGLLSSSQQVIQLTVDVLPIVLPSLVSDAINCVCMSVLRAAGRQGLGAAMNCVAYWCVGVPLSALFGLHLQMGVRGFWLGLLITSAAQSVVLSVFVLGRFDWEHEVRRAAELVAEHEQEVSAAKAAAAVLSLAAGSPAGAGDSRLQDAAAADLADASLERDQSHSLVSSSGGTGEEVRLLLHSAGRPSGRSSGIPSSSSSSSSSSNSGSSRQPQQRSRFFKEQQQQQQQSLSGAAGSSSRRWWQWWRQRQGSNGGTLADVSAGVGSGLQQQQQQQAVNEQLPLLSAQSSLEAGSQRLPALQHRLSINQPLIMERSGSQDIL